MPYFESLMPSSCSHHCLLELTEYRPLGLTDCRPAMLRFMRCEEYARRLVRLSVLCGQTWYMCRFPTIVPQSWQFHAKSAAARNVERQAADT